MDVLTSGNRLETTEREFTPLINSDPPDLLPPFVVRRVDESLLKERNFCGVVGGVHSDAHSPIKSPSKPFKSPTHKDEGVRLEQQYSPERNSYPGEKGTVRPRYCSPRRTPCPDEGVAVLPSSLRTSPWNDRKLPSHLDQQHRLPYSPISSTTSSSSSPSQVASPSPSHQQPCVVTDDLVSKYLTNSSGNRKASPPGGHVHRECSAEAIGEKLEKLRRECCECLVSEMVVPVLHLHGSRFAH